MIDFKYTYKIIKSIPEYGSLEVEYSADGKETITRGMSIPSVNVDLDQYIKNQAPYFEWVVSKEDKHEIIIGHTAEVAPTPVEIKQPQTDDVGALIAAISKDEFDTARFKTKVQQIVEEILVSKV